MTENTPGSLPRRTVVAGAAWTVPVVATAIGAPLAAASDTTPPVDTSNFDRYIVWANTNVGAVGGGQTPIVDALIRTAGPTAGTQSYAVVRIPAQYLDIGYVNANFLTPGHTNGWNYVTSYIDGGYAVYQFSNPTVPVPADSDSVFRWTYRLASNPGLVGTSYTVDVLSQVSPGDRNPGNNVWVASPAVAYVQP
ncbi:hypothetical protein C1I63_08750 [Rathayibacter caricis DSM 15933]|jgi:hypothetical protein|uniref:Uncharacterized protein n=1 Tax=Rathayibacter caricis DSM 15933 TaxID=1328867 RepID=A0A2T4UTR7_9MICO|nr:hypothetical protein [Rathayibacter caricis]MCJ1695501.1 hypothetical protein [Rathayibacter caricis]PTL72928.1 hypothetical protein C1I63_08750 [Rathayibacter caricis DSM 15933]